MAAILMITAMGGAANCAAILSKQFQLDVDLVSSRREALAALRCHEYELIIVDEAMIDPDDDPDHAAGDALFAHAGFAIPVEVNFAISGTGRLVRLVRSSLARRHHERELARRAASAGIATEQRDTVAGLLLHAQLALTEPGLTAAAESRLRTIVELATKLSKSCVDSSQPACSQGIQLFSAHPQDPPRTLATPRGAATPSRTLQTPPHPAHPPTGLYRPERRPRTPVSPPA